MKTGTTLVLFLLAAYFICPSACAIESRKSEHFIVYYERGVPREYVDKIIGAAESYYDTITAELGFNRYEGFWTWDNRAKIYLYRNREEYESLVDKKWSEAEVNVITREIKAYMNMEDFVDIILPHELTHIIFREFVGFKRKLPLWLDEGVASFLEKKRIKERLGFARALIKTTAFVPFDKLNRIERGSVVIPQVFYSEAASIIEFLVRAYGKDKFMEFCRRTRELKDYQGWEVALKETYGFKDLRQMGERWEVWLKG